MLVGIDEAGRGPVLGSMFVAAIAVPSVDVLPDGLRDSKRIGADERERLADRIAEIASVGVAEVPVDAIDDGARNLNELTIDASGRAATEVLESRSARIIADACDVDADRYGRRLRATLPSGVEVAAFHEADATEPVVGAASIVAKSRRETHVSRLGDEYGEIGSGYPGDATTRTFLRRYVEREGTLPACARRSWRTSRSVLEAAAQESLSEF